MNEARYMFQICNFIMCLFLYITRLVTCSKYAISSYMFIFVYYETRYMFQIRNFIICVYFCMLRDSLHIPNTPFHHMCFFLYILRDSLHIPNMQCHHMCLFLYITRFVTYSKYAISSYVFIFIYYETRHIFQICTFMRCWFLYISWDMLIFAYSKLTSDLLHFQIWNCMLLICIVSFLLYVKENIIKIPYGSLIIFLPWFLYFY